MMWQGNGSITCGISDSILARFKVLYYSANVDEKQRLFCHTSHFRYQSGVAREQVRQSTRAVKISIRTALSTIDYIVDIRYSS